MPSKGLPKKYAKMGFKKGWAAYKRSKRTAPKRTTYRSKPKMARRRNYRKIYRRARSGGGGVKPIIDGVLAGALGGVASSYLGGMGQPIATLGIGYFRNNATLKTLGAFSLGSMLANQLTGGGSGGGGGGFN